MDELNERCEKLGNEIAKISREKENCNVQIEKLQECESKMREILSQSEIYSETISTLQKDLVSEKLDHEKLKVNVEKLGLNQNILDDDVNVIVEHLLENVDFANIITTALKNKLQDDVNEEANVCRNCDGNPRKLDADVLSQTEVIVASVTAEWNKQCEKLCAELALSQQLVQQLQTENARMQVDVATFTSQVNSLQTQQTALQLANSQLVAEKEEVRIFLRETRTSA